MKKLLIKLGLLMALPLTALQIQAADWEYTSATAKTNAEKDPENWMKYLPDDVFVAHVSIPGTHDTATAEGWESSTGSTMSTTQKVNIDEQLAGGIRAFDFRPGLYKEELWCNHGTDRTSLKLEDAFAKLTSFLDNHRTEFFVVHLFRGNVYRTGEMGSTIEAIVKRGLGASDSAEDQATYNNLFNELFNKKLDGYIVEYSPYLKVDDVRGKIIIFRRDRIDFAHIYNAGNLYNWPGSEENWTDNSIVSVVLDSDPSVTGRIRATDVSSPDNEAELNIELNSITNLFKWNCNQTRPNAAMESNGTYKPDWTMIFTSGAYNGENTAGYRANAKITNPHFIGEIENAAPKGPTGIVFSDWVLTDENEANGIKLIPTIYLNNFDYIDEFRLDDNLFASNNEPLEIFWDENKQYFMRNVQSGDFLSAGEWWGTHAVTAAHGIKIKPVLDKESRTYTIKSTLNTEGGLGTNMYIDNVGDHRAFKVSKAGDGAYIFTYKDNGVTKALGIDEKFVEGDFAADGTTHNVDCWQYVSDNPSQQWELISVDDYYADQMRRACPDHGVDIAFYHLPGARFFGNDSENSGSNWVFSKGGWFDTKAIKSNRGVGDTECRRSLFIYNNSKSGTGWDASWKLSNNISTLPKGYYEVRWKAYSANIDVSDKNFSMKINNTEYKSKIKKGSVVPKQLTDADGNKYDEFYVQTIGTEMADESYTCSTGLMEITDGKLNINMACPTHSSPVAIVFDDFEVIYYGPYPADKYPVLVRAMVDAKCRLVEMGKTVEGVSENSIDFTEYEKGINSNAYSDDGTAAALEIYNKLQALTFEKQADNQKSHQDYTNVIINGGFETGTLLGWKTSYEGPNSTDTGVKPTNHNTYKMDGSKNNFLFNTWQGAGSEIGKGAILSQTIKGLPAGHYIVTAQAANDANSTVFISVNEQRSEPFVLTSDGSVSKLISFSFEVAENTEEVTISFMGGRKVESEDNTGGAFDDFGGNWYKIDDVRLYREGEADLCVFFKRLVDAANRADIIAHDTFTPEYYNQWLANDGRMAVQDLISTHLTDEGAHEGDLGGSNGLPERDQLFTSLSQFALAQKYTEANMTAAIRNNSFELGDLSYWNTKAATPSDSRVDETNEGDYNIVKRHQDHIYYTKHVENNYAHAYPIYQTISGVPKGHYTLSAMVASDKDNQFYLAVNDKPSEVCTTTDPKTFQPIYMEFEVTDENGEDIRIGLFPSKSGSFSAELEPEVDNLGPWYAVDNFELKLVGRKMSIDWVMETPTHGTIILPFAVGADELKKKGLEIYSLNHHEEATAQGATHKILVYEHQDEIKANTPYIVMVAGQAVPVAKGVKVKAASADENVTGLTYTFEGITSNKADEYKEPYQDGALTGVLVPTPADESQYHLQSYDDNIGFILHKDGPHDDLAVEPYHAYITLPEESQGDVNIHGLYFEEPILPLEWMMEGKHYGTIILPFAVAKEDMPKGLVARKISGVSTSRNAITHTYQIAQLGVEEESLEANVPYLVYSENPVEDAITFRGMATNEKNEYLEGVLKGSLQKHDSEDESSLQGDHWVLYEDEDGTAYFVMINENTTLNANHAYIFNPNAGETPVESASVKGVKLMADEPSATPSADLILLSEDQAEQTYPWQMDNEFVGTIVMPFDVDASVLSENSLEAYKVETARRMQTKNGITYHILDRAPETDGLKANMAYMLTPSGEVPDKIEFTGAPDAKTLELYGLMLGTYSLITAPENSYVANAEKGLDFKKVGAEGAPVAQLHAYIPAASDLTGTYLVVNDDTVDVTEIMEGEVNVDIYTLDGVLVRRDVKAAEALQELDRGIYILRSAKGTVKVIK